ncbi:MAG: HepT-like ribonuclease domain-containing protein, partial [Bacteroidota bacterium]
GEAMKEALVIDSELPVSNARKIVNARNKIIHGYDEVDDAVIWSIVIRHIPILRKEIVDLLNS